MGPKIESNIGVRNYVRVGVTEVYLFCLVLFLLKNR